MSRSYDTHGICTLKRRQKRRRNGPLDGRTRAGQRAEALRSELIRDKGGADISAVTLATIELCVRDAAWLDECDEAIAAFLNKRPEVRKNPKSLATLYGYRQPMANALNKNLASLGADRVAPPTQSLEDYLSERYGGSNGGNDSEQESNGEGL